MAEKRLLRCAQDDHNWFADGREQVLAQDGESYFANLSNLALAENGEKLHLWLGDIAGNKDAEGARLQDVFPYGAAGGQAEVLAVEIDGDRGWRGR